MSDQVKVSRVVFGKNTFQTVVDTNFSQLVPQDPSVTTSTPTDVKSFFNSYNDLFYDIPLSGSFSGSLGYTHLDLVNRSSDYLGISLNDMEAEIKELRSENVSLRNQIFTLTQQTGSTITA